MENMVDGLAMFDAAGRLIICNAQYGRMYGLSDRVMMQGHQAMTPIRSCKRMIELRESFFAAVAARGTRKAAVEKHDPPGTEVAETADCEWVCPKFPLHDRRIVMIARYA